MKSVETRTFPLKTELDVTNEQDHIGEECGLVAIAYPHPEIHLVARAALLQLQHRGPQSAGISDQFITIKGVGSVSDVLTDEKLLPLTGILPKIGHVRYSTSDPNNHEQNHNNAQPIGQTFVELTEGEYTIKLGMNGNINDERYITENLTIPYVGTSDTARLAALLVQQRPKYNSWLETLSGELSNFDDAAMNLVIITDDGRMYVIRSKDGIHPLCFGEFEEGGVIAASESSALDAVNAHYIRELKAGEIMCVNADGERFSTFYGKPQNEQFCGLELGYFARPDSHLEGFGPIWKGRKETGKRLARYIAKKGLPIDEVVGVPDSGTPGGLGAAEGLGVPYNSYILRRREATQRSFLDPGPTTRQQVAAQKLAVTPQLGEDTLIVDDSIVRSNMLKRTLFALRKANARDRRIHIGSVTGMVTKTCGWGVSIPSTDELPAAGFAAEIEGTEDEKRAHVEKRLAEMEGINAASVTYLPMGEFFSAFGRSKDTTCYHCFGGPSPAEAAKHNFPQKEKPLQGNPRLLLLGSGNGTNIEAILQAIEEKTILADVAGIIVGREGVPLIERSLNHGIEPSIHPHKKFKNTLERSVYDQQLFDQIIASGADVVVLAGWMHIMSDALLEELQKQEITVINLHPALITADGSDNYISSHGSIPVIRGTHAIQDAYEQGLRLSGVTVHQLLPNLKTFDAGPIILREEVPIHENESLAQFEARMHAREYKLLPTAINRVLHVIRHNIDTSKGEFPW